MNKKKDNFRLHKNQEKAIMTGREQEMKKVKMRVVPAGPHKAVNIFTSPKARRFRALSRFRQTGVLAFSGKEAEMNHHFYFPDFRPCGSRLPSHSIAKRVIPLAVLKHLLEAPL